MSPLPYTLTLLSTSPLRAAALFPPTHPAFDGHFPGNPILPAFMHLQLAVDTLRLANLPHALKEISAAKFTRPILPSTPITITLLPIDHPNTYDATLLLADNQPASTFTLTVG